MDLYDAGVDLHKAQEAPTGSPLRWLGKLVVLLFEEGELTGKLGRVRIYTNSDNGTHSVFAWVKVPMRDGKDYFLSTTTEPVNSNDVYDVWV
jgi:GTP cyclohydrolase II